MSRTVLSFDVGIVNLAYCILKKSNDNFEILKWDIINIDDNKLICTHMNKQNIACNKNAKYQFNENHYCSAHYNSFMKDFSKKNDKLFIDKKTNDKCCIMKCKNTCDKTFNEHNYCVKHFDKIKKEYISSNTPKKIKSQNSNYKSIGNLSNFLFSKLDVLKDDFLTVDEVLIENQPSLINPTMKTISSLLYAYFTLRGIIDRNINIQSKITSVNFISPQNKLKLDKNTTNTTLNKEDLKKREEYILTKDLGKKYCRCLINEKPEYLTILNSHKKSDDLCDSFLQGFYYLFYKDGNFPNKYKSLLEKTNNEYKKIELEKEKKKMLKKLEISIKNTVIVDDK